MSLLESINHLNNKENTKWITITTQHSPFRGKLPSLLITSNAQANLLIANSILSVSIHHKDQQLEEKKIGIISAGVPIGCSKFSLEHSHKLAQLSPINSQAKGLITAVSYIIDRESLTRPKEEPRRSKHSSSQRTPTRS